MLVLSIPNNQLATGNNNIITDPGTPSPDWQQVSVTVNKGDTLTFSVSNPLGLPFRVTCIEPPLSHSLPHVPVEPTIAINGASCTLTFTECDDFGFRVDLGAEFAFLTIHVGSADIVGGY